MDSPPITAEDHRDAAALLAWQVELGATEAIAETPLNRYDLPETAPTPAPVSSQATAPDAAKTPSAAPAPIPARNDPVERAETAAAGAGTLEALRDAMARFEGCELKRGARNLVFADGRPESRVMVIGEAPGRDEDAQGKPFVGRAGQLLDRMFAAISMGRTRPGAEALYITNILPWQPPGNRDPEAAEIAMMLPFVRRHVDLAAPDILVLMGNISCQALLGRKGITRLRGTWTEALNRPVLPMFHPAYLLRNPAAKRDAWHDLLMLQDRLRR